MEILKNLFYGFPDLWGGGVAHSVMILSLVIALGLCLGKLRVKGVSLGLAWILFIGLIFGHFSLNLDEHLLHFLKEFGLILFVYSIGLEVGPGFFASFKNGGKSLNLLSMIVVALSIITTLVIFSFSGTSITSMAGILSGAVTNTPGLGAAQQAFSDLRHIDAPSIAAGYAIAYPMGVLGVILSFIILRFALRVDKQKEEDEAKRGKGHLEAMTLNTFAVKVSNQMVFKDTVKQIRYLLKRDFMVSKIIRNNGERQDEVVNGQTVIEEDQAKFLEKVEQMLVKVEREMSKDKADRENRFFQLPALYLSQEIGLVFHRIRTRDKPFIAIFIRFGLRIMPRGDEVVVVTHLLIEGAKLNQAVAHHVRIRRKTSLHLLHRITGYLVPIFMMAVNHLQLAPILSSHSRSHLQVLLRRAVPLLFLLRTNLDVEAIRMQAQLGKLPNHNRTVDASRKEHGNSLIFYFINIQHILSSL
jgi:AspT/YidE/YbjL antiporter-like protein